MTDREKAIVMAYTGCTMLAGDKLGIYYQYVREKLGRSVMTHEFAYKDVQGAIKEAVKEDFIAIAKDTNVLSNGWISVKDRLPEPPAQCLVYSAKASRPRGMETATYTGCGWMTAAYFPGITHWMLLPEVPEEENDG